MPLTTVWKFPVTHSANWEIDLPSDHEVIEVRAVAGVPYMWIKVDPKSPQQRFRFASMLTGKHIDDARHVAMWEQPVIYHLWEFE